MSAHMLREIDLETEERLENADDADFLALIEKLEAERQVPDPLPAEPDAELDAEPDDDADGNLAEQWSREMLRYPLLSSEDELKLGKRVLAAREAGRRDKDAEERLVLSNLRLAAQLARRRIGSFESIGALTYLDLYQEAAGGLKRACKTWDYRKGRFTTHATSWCRQAMSRAIADTSRTIRYPVYVSTLVSRRKAVREAFEQEHRRPPTEEELRAYFTASEWETIALVPQDSLSLDLPIYREDGSTATLADTLIDERPYASHEDVDEEEAVSSLMRRINDLLGPRERLILELRSPLREGGPMTLTGTGQALEAEGYPSITRERVRQIEEAALMKLWRSGLREDGSFVPHETEREADLYARHMLIRRKERSKHQGALGNLRPDRTAAVLAERPAERARHQAAINAALERARAAGMRAGRRPSYAAS
jgi:RNA polymerase sigma factor (sigma-70 family)